MKEEKDAEGDVNNSLHAPDLTNNTASSTVASNSNWSSDDQGSTSTDVTMKVLKMTLDTNSAVQSNGDAVPSVLSCVSQEPASIVTTTSAVCDKANNDTTTSTAEAAAAAAHVPVIAKAASCASMIDRTQYKVMMMNIEPSTAASKAIDSAQPSTSASSSRVANNEQQQQQQVKSTTSHASNKDRESPFSSIDEGIEDMEDIDIDNKTKVSRRTLYQCTWRGCNFQCLQCHTIEQHIRVTHLGRKPDEIVDQEESDREEEFYYNELEIEDNSPTFSVNSSSAVSSLPSPSPMSPNDAKDHVSLQQSTTPTTSVSHSELKMSTAECVLPGVKSEITSNHPDAQDQSSSTTQVKSSQPDDGPMDLSLKIKCSLTMAQSKTEASPMDSLNRTSLPLPSLQPLVVKAESTVACVPSAAKLFQFPPALSFYGPFGHSAPHPPLGNHSSSLSSGSSSAYYSSSPSSSSTKSWSALVDEIETFQQQQQQQQQQQTSKLSPVVPAQVSSLAHSPGLSSFQFQPHPGHLYRHMMAAAAAAVVNNHHHHHHSLSTTLDHSRTFGNTGASLAPSTFRVDESLMHTNVDAPFSLSPLMKPECLSMAQPASSPVKSNVIKFCGSSPSKESLGSNSKTNSSETSGLKRSLSPAKYGKPLQGSFEYYLNQINVGISKPSHGLAPSPNVGVTPSGGNSASPSLACSKSGQPNRTPLALANHKTVNANGSNPSIPIAPRRRGRPPGSTNKKKRLLLEQQQQQQLLCAMQNMVPGMLPQLISLPNANTGSVNVEGFDKFAHQKASFESQMVAALAAHHQQSLFGKIGSSLGHAGGGGRKPRGESRKCRKVYGMNNREQWCTQCKWKKACSRFTD